jgi:hypothetical protein
MLSQGYWQKSHISDGASQFILGNTGELHEVSEQTDLQGCVAMNRYGNAREIAGFGVKYDDFRSLASAPTRAFRVSDRNLFPKCFSNGDV